MRFWVCREDSEYASKLDTSEGGRETDVFVFVCEVCSVSRLRERRILFGYFWRNMRQDVGFGETKTTVQTGLLLAAKGEGKLRGD